MTSKRSFADLLKENTKRRLWPIALTIAGNFFAQIVYAMMMFNQYSYRIMNELTTRDEAIGDYILKVGGLGNFPVFLIVIGLALINGIQGYSYLFDQRTSDLYGALPVKREKLFDSINLNGILIFAIPYIICHIITNVFAFINGYMTVEGIIPSLCTVVSVLVMYVFNYEVCVLAAMLTGHVVVAGLACFTFYAVGPFILYFRTSLLSTFYMSYYYNYTDADIFIASPMGLYSKIMPQTDWYEITSQDAYKMATGISHIVFICLILAVVLFVVSRALHKARSMEAAGKAMAFEKTKPVIKIILEIVVAVGAALLMYYLNSHSFGMMVFGCVCGLVIMHVLMETIYEFDFKASKSNLWSMFVSAGITAAIFIVCILDIGGYESWQPRTDLVDSAAIFDDLTYQNVSYRSGRGMRYNGSDEFASDNMKITDIESLEKITSTGATYARDKHIERIFLRSTDSYDYAASENGKHYFASIGVKWNLKNGKTVYRNYYVDMLDRKNVEEFAKLFDSNEYKYGKVQALTVSGNEINNISFDEVLSSNDSIDLKSEEADELIECYREDVENQKLSDLEKELPDVVFDGNFVSTNGLYEKNNYVCTFIVYPSFTKTKAFLDKHQIPSSWKEGDEQVKELNLFGNYYNEDLDDVTDIDYKTGDANTINSLLDSMVPSSYYTINSRLFSGFGKNDDSLINAECYFGIPGKSNYLSITLFCNDSIPAELKKDAFPLMDNDSTTQAKSGTNAGWVECVNMD